MTGSGGFKFTVPTLPREVYDNVKAVAEESGVSYWHVVLMAMDLLSQARREDRERLAEQILRRHPYPGYKGKKTGGSVNGQRA